MVAFPLLLTRLAAFAISLILVCIPPLITCKVNQKGSKMKKAVVTNPNTGMITLEEICEILEDPTQLPGFLAKNRMSEKFYRQADEHHREVHGLARTVIQAIEGAKNQDELVKALKATTSLSTNDLVALVLNALIEYQFPKDAQFLSRDKAIQQHLRNVNKDGAEAPAFIKSLGGIAAIYAAYRAAKRGN